MMSRRTGGDPTMPTDPNAPAITFNNPGFREGGRNGKKNVCLNLFELLKIKLTNL